MELERWFVFAMAVYVGGWFAWTARPKARSGDTHERENQSSERGRLQRADDARERVSAWARYALALVGFGTALGCFAGVVSPTVGYAILCLSLVTRFVTDLLSEERAPRRRSAILGRSRKVNPVLLAWIAIAMISPFALVPYILAGADRVAAIVVALCVATMVALAWRIASAPPLLLGSDLDAEQIVDCKTRAIRTGNACFMAIAAAGTFNGFEGFARRSMSATYTSEVSLAMLIVLVGLFAWTRFYAWQVSQTPIAS